MGDVEGCSCRVLECHPQCFNPLNNAPGYVCGCAFVCRSMCVLMGFNTCTGGQQRLAAECIGNRTPFKHTHSLASKMLAHDSYGEQASCNAVGDWVAGDRIYFIFTNTRGKVQTTFFSCLCPCTWIRKKIKKHICWENEQAWVMLCWNPGFFIENFLLYKHNNFTWLDFLRSQERKNENVVKDWHKQLGQRWALWMLM